MFNHRQTILASRPAATVLALALVAGLAAPFLMLPQAQAAGDPPLPCTENNANGCTELSPTPPQDTVAVPPNIVLMLDDSGSMRWDVMPDYGSLGDTSPEALIDSDVNGVYFNPDPTVGVYTPPPKADGSFYPPADFDAALVDGFDTGSATVDLSTYRGVYDSFNVSYKGTPVQYSISLAKVGATSYDPASKCPVDTDKNATKSQASAGQPGYCYFDQSHVPEIPYVFFTNNGNNFYFYVSRCNSVSDVYDYNGGLGKDKCYPGISFFTYTTTNPLGGYTRHYVAKTAGDCKAVGLTSNCIDGSADPAAADVIRQNIANWFSYYHTRILMAKSGLMTAFDKLSPNYRFGFGSINDSNKSNLPKPRDTFGSNWIAEVQPFGDGSSGTQRAAFWNWVATMAPGSSTPLRKSLQAVGKYYQSDQPWTAMPGDPGYTSGSTKPIYACRASYTILTTDGFWNGPDPTGIGGNSDNKQGDKYTPPAGDGYPVTQYLPADPYSDSYGDTLADVANYYWKTDLRPDIPNKVAPSLPADPAFWQHMTTYTMGLGFVPTGIKGTDADGNPVTIPEIFAWANGGPAITGFGWPKPGKDSINNIADLAHAAVNGHGDFFSATSPQALAEGFAKAIANITARDVKPTPASVNARTLAAGALAFSTGYSTKDWSGQFWAKALDETGNVVGDPVWNAGTKLDARTYTDRKVYTAAYDGTKTPAFTSFALTAGNSTKLDSWEMAGLMSPPSTDTSKDNAKTRIQFLLGDRSKEGTVYHSRSSVLGAIIRSQPVYVSYPGSGYYSTWPSGSPEAATGAQTYDAFFVAHKDRPGTAYVGANDGMLHAFATPAPDCSVTPCSYGDGGTERWAFVPRAVYDNLGNLTRLKDFNYRPTVDETPVTRDVFFSDQKWHTILAGGVGLGGRGVYALDITDPTAFTATNVLWEFDSDMAVDSKCVASFGDCKATDLGYTLSQPNIGRLANGKWMVLVPNGYFPDCYTPDIPTEDQTSCEKIAAQAPRDTKGNPYSALFVLDAETGKMIAELKTPTVAGVTSFGLATPVLGDYGNDQVDDVAFAGDAQGNLWRFNLSSSDPSKWTVTLAYKGVAVGGKQGQQPITTMPRLFPDPATNRFMVVFGTGKFLGVGDNSNVLKQAVYGVRDQGDDATSAMAYVQSDLVQQFLHETLAPDKLPDGTANPVAGATLRCVTGKATDSCDTTSKTNPPSPVNQVPPAKGGWRIDLYTTADDGTQTDAGERVVVNPGAIFASNTVVLETLITGSSNSDPCSPSTQGAIMALNAVSGAPAGVSSLGGWPMVGGRITAARTSGSLPVVSALGGGQAYLPGASLAPSGTITMSVDAPIWRRRSWHEIHKN